MTVPCRCTRCEHQMSWHRAIDKCGDEIRARCEVPGCFCINESRCEHVSGIEDDGFETADQVFRALGIAAE